GTGLGMAITKQFVELLGGTIRVESRLGEGTRFFVDMPIEYTEESQFPEMAEDEEIDISGMKILVAEDNEINMEITTMFIEEAGGSVEQAFDGKEAADLFMKSPPGTFQAILMDVMMPKMNGLESTRIIRSSNHPDARGIPIIATTANAYEEDIRAVMDAGMNAHLSKPLDVDKMLKLLSRCRKKD
ncbi:MAG: response regulator, partial [Lachnospiraceae bacterium]|nr:response regulator [Lachnospiraceae bacterium]